jgi:hypothetical protein
VNGTELPGIAEKMGLQDCDSLEHVDTHTALTRIVCVAYRRHIGQSDYTAVPQYSSNKIYNINLH